MGDATHLHIAIPAMEEADYIPICLEALFKQDYKNFTIYICVNQPEKWWTLDNRKHICENNLKTLNYLNRLNNPQIKIIDKSSPGLGWGEKLKGVGIARKTLMDYIAESAHPHDIIVSMDADTTVGENYFSSIVEVFSQCPDMLALSNPYYHKLTGDEATDRAILRYELYMRTYALNLWRIGCPNPFTALGSAIALTVSAYNKVRGIDPKSSGEDFYFLLKLSKAGYVGNYNTSLVYPAARFSSRVIFGTGPAMIEINRGQTETYSIYHHSFFDEIKEFYNSISALFSNKKITSTFNDFLRNHLKDDDPWQALRKNYPKYPQFWRAVHQKADRLRILQFLKHNQLHKRYKDEQSLNDFFSTFYDSVFTISEFENTSVEKLNEIRDFLFSEEQKLQQSDFKKKCIGQSYY